MTAQGVRLLPVYVGSGTVYTGSARLVQEARDAAETSREQQNFDDKRDQFLVKRRLLESQIAALRSELAAGQSVLSRLTREQRARQYRIAMDKSEMSKMRGATSTEETATHERI
jgi:circadian clock protein KaiC